MHHRNKRQEGQAATGAPVVKVAPVVKEAPVVLLAPVARQGLAVRVVQTSLEEVHKMPIRRGVVHLHRTHHKPTAQDLEETQTLADQTLADQVAMALTG